MNENRILAINPGTRKLGVAVFTGADLLYYGIKVIKAGTTTKQVGQGVGQATCRLIAEYQPRALVLTRPLVIQQSSQGLVASIREVKQAAQRQGVAVYEYAPKTVRQFVCGSKNATRHNLIQAVSARYPELLDYAMCRSEWEEAYYGKMFEAVAAGLAYYYSSSPSEGAHSSSEVLKANGNQAA